MPAMKRSLRAYLLACLLAAALPLLGRPDRPTMSAVAADAFPGWPASFESRPLTPVALSERDRHFAEGFPGRVAAFTDGRRQFVIRWVARPTRKLHPAAHCFRGAGYAVTPLPLMRDAQGHAWGGFTARRAGTTLTVCEQVSDGQGCAWPDISAWYWAALLGRTSGPWWSLTVVE